MAMSNPNIIDNIGTRERDTTSLIDFDYDDSVLAQDQITSSHSLSSNLDLALVTHVPNTPTNTTQQQRIESANDNLNHPLNLLSRVILATVKYPDHATLFKYSDLQLWMYIHANKRSFIDICETLTHMLTTHSNHFDSRQLLNVRLICAEAYQTIGLANQAHCFYDQVEFLIDRLNNSTNMLTYHEQTERDQIRKKKEDIRMKLEFQADFQSNMFKSGKHRKFMQNDILTQLDMDNPSPEKCRFLWRQIVLELALNPEIAIRSSQWLLSYADRHPSNTLQHANSLYVALNLFLFGSGSSIFQQQQQQERNVNIDVFKMLNELGRYFEEYGNQSKQFSPIHKMAHIWGTAAVAYYLASEKYKYFVCASIMRVSFELLGICFLSSGIESLYMLARIHAPEFFMIMSNDPGIKLSTPICINYFRRRLENSPTCIRYSNQIVHEFMLDAFNADQSHNRI
ncbi:hypothetical protein I4U23_009936 [Adineta vaga]|nr:hypothetical protein I4U23_009936 [Adineta vaga]